MEDAALRVGLEYARPVAVAVAVILVVLERGDVEDASLPLADGVRIDGMRVLLLRRLDDVRHANLGLVGVVGRSRRFGGSGRVLPVDILEFLHRLDHLLERVALQLVLLCNLLEQFLNDGIVARACTGCLPLVERVRGGVLRVARADGKRGRQGGEDDGVGCRCGPDQATDELVCVADLGQSRMASGEEETPNAPTRANVPFVFSTSSFSSANSPTSPSTLMNLTTLSFPHSFRNLRTNCSAGGRASFSLT